MIKKIIPQTFKARLIILLGLGQILFLSSLLTIGYQFISGTLHEQMDKRIIAFTSQFESSLKSAMISMDSATLNSIALQAIELPDISEFAIYLGDRQLINQISPREASNQTLRISHKVVSGGQEFGRFQFAISIDEVEKSKKIIFTYLALICLLEFALAILLTLLIGRYVGNRSNYLVTGIKKYAAGDSEFRYTAITNDEFGVIASTLNDMAIKNSEDAKNLEQLRLQGVETAKMASLGEMASGIAHEVNTPLTIIQSKAAMMIRKIKANNITLEKVESELEIVQNTTKRIAKIVSGLSTFSRNAENDAMEPMKIVEVLDDSLTLCNERFKKFNVDLRTDLQIPAGCLILGRPAQIAQVVLNLLNNAFDAIEQLPDKWVELRAVANGTILQISVTDSGDGIAPDVLNKLMEPFFTTKPIGKGTGLGLSISKGIVEGHNGRFYYDTSSPKTRFVIELPILNTYLV